MLQNYVFKLLSISHIARSENNGIEIRLYSFNMRHAHLKFMLDVLSFHIQVQAGMFMLAALITTNEYNSLSVYLYVMLLCCDAILSLTLRQQYLK